MRTSEAELAFTVHNPGDPVPATLRGTVFYTPRFDPSQHRAVLLLHGGTLIGAFGTASTFQVLYGSRLSSRITAIPPSSQSIDLVTAKAPTTAALVPVSS